MTIKRDEAPLLAGGARKLLKEADEYDGYLAYPVGEVTTGQAKLFLVYDAPADIVNLKIKGVLGEALEELGRGPDFAAASTVPHADLPIVLGKCLDMLNFACLKRKMTATIAIVLYRDGHLATAAVGDAAVVIARRSETGHVILIESPGLLVPQFAVAASTSRLVESGSRAGAETDSSPRQLGERLHNFTGSRLHALRVGDKVLLTSDGLPDSTDNDWARIASALDRHANDPGVRPAQLAPALLRDLIAGTIRDDVTLVLLEERLGVHSRRRLIRGKRVREQRARSLKREEREISLQNNQAELRRTIEMLEKDFAAEFDRTSDAITRLQRELIARDCQRRPRESGVSRGKSAAKPSDSPRLESRSLFKRVPPYVWIGLIVLVVIVVIVVMRLPLLGQFKPAAGPESFP